MLLRHLLVVALSEAVIAVVLAVLTVAAQVVRDILGGLATLLERARVDTTVLHVVTFLVGLLDATVLLGH